MAEMADFEWRLLDTNVGMIRLDNWQGEKAKTTLIGKKGLAEGWLQKSQFN
jgi:hypothetical protein